MGARQPIVGYTGYSDWMRSHLSRSLIVVLFFEYSVVYASAARPLKWSFRFYGIAVYLWSTGIQHRQAEI